jgi:DNA-binding transcriptional MerR regulator
MKIGELARRSGLAPSRIRFYEAEGLLRTVSRRANGYREYPPEALRMLGIITCAQQTGFSLQEIRQLLPADLSHCQHDALVGALRKKIADIEAMENRLRQSKAHLQALVCSIENKPEGMDCADNAKRVFDDMRREGAVPDFIPPPAAGPG